MDSDSDDDNVHFGTPLEPLEEGSAAKRRPPALEDQTVRDSRGRQRFHGAFTGGFSAGFFNTVGSKDGFQPATFVSSRSTRADRRTARPDDFMDDEDRGEHGIAPQRLQTKSDFRETPSGVVKRKHPQFDEGPIPGEPVLSQLVKPVRDTVGVRILKSMGWRPGQGIGPRISRKEKKRQQKVYGCARPPGFESAAPPDSGSDSDSDSALREVLLAPDDSEAPLVRPKHDQMGLGYRGLERRSVLGPTSADATLRYRDKAGKLAIKGQAFGVGAFEEDDDDIYGTEDMSNYDFESAPERTTSRATPSAADRLAHTLSGFRLSESKRSARQRYPPPPLPPGFDPRHKARASRFEPLPEERRGLERHRLSAGQRADMIGEQRLPQAAETASSAGVQAGSQAGAPAGALAGAQAGVQAEVHATTADATATSTLPGRPAGSQPLLTATQRGGTTPQSAPTSGMAIKTEPGVAAPQTEQTSGDADRLKEVHKLLAESADTPGSAAPTLKPFARDPEKQARYEQFLKLSAANRKDDYRLLVPASMTDWEREREISEFQRSALIFRPLAASLADRFVSAGTSEQERPSLAAGTGTAEAADPATQAARRKMFGMLTRQKQEWHPAPLLCRRFNVKNPFPHSSIVGTLGPTSGATSSLSELVLRPPSPAEAQQPAAPKPRLRWDDMLADEAASEGPSSGIGTGNAATQPAALLALPSSETVTTQPAAAPTQKPPADLFKAIFDDSDTESESEGAAEKADSPGTPPPTGTSQVATAPSQPAVTSAVTHTPPPSVTPLGTDRLSTSAAAPSTAAGEEAVQSGPSPSSRPPGQQGQSRQPGAAAGRPTAASFFDQAPPAAAKRPGFSLFDNVDLDELNSWKRGSGGGGDAMGGGDGGGIGGGKGGSDSSKKSVDAPTASASAARNGASSSEDEYGPRLPPGPPAGTSSRLPVSCVGRKDRSGSDVGEWRERSPTRQKKKKHKKSEKKRKKSKNRGSDSDSSDSSDVDKALLKKLRDVVKKKKKKKKKSSSRY